MFFVLQQLAISAGQLVAGLAEELEHLLFVDRTEDRLLSRCAY